MWAVVMFGAVIVVAVVVAALLTKFGGRALGMEPEDSSHVRRRQVCRSQCGVRARWLRRLSRPQIRSAEPARGAADDTSGRSGHIYAPL